MDRSKITALNLRIAPLRNLIHPAVLLLTKIRVKFRVDVGSSCLLLPDHPAIFAVNHTNSFDAPIAARAISRTYGLRCDVLGGKQRMWLSDRLYFLLNGAIWVDRKSNSEMAGIKNVLIAYLKAGQSIMWFPEGTWNLTDSLLMLPMKWGIIDVAAQAGAQIIPVALDYNRNNMICNVRFGTPIAPDEKTDKTLAIRTLRDAMATLRWEMWEESGRLNRDTVDLNSLRAEMFKALEEYPPLDWEYEQSIIFRPY